jgi:hypothetical protein
MPIFRQIIFPAALAAQVSGAAEERSCAPQFLHKAAQHRDEETLKSCSAETAAS